MEEREEFLDEIDDLSDFSFTDVEDIPF
jgi:hypothetical protein